MGARQLDLTTRVVISEDSARFTGTYSDVYLGRLCNQDGLEMVAVKRIKYLSPKSTKAMRRKIRRELEIGATLEHPNIASFYGYADDSDMFGPWGAFVSPWYEHGDAGRFLHLHGHKLSTSSRSTLWKGVISGLDYLHTFSPVIIHGDIKPGNILIDNDVNPRICDFGISRIVAETDTGLTTTSPHTATERYLAYELVLSDDKPTMATDIYSLGCVGLLMLSLQHPHANHGANASAYIISDIADYLPPASRPSSLDPLFDSLWDIFDSCWDPNPDNRPNTGVLAKSHEQWHADLTAALGVSDISEIELLKVTAKIEVMPNPTLAPPPPEPVTVEEIVAEEVKPEGKPGDPDQLPEPNDADTPVQRQGDQEERDLAEALERSLQDQHTIAESQRAEGEGEASTSSS